MRAMLWPDASVEEHRKELDAWMANAGSLPSTIFACEGDDDPAALAGFIEVGSRSHADGCDPARPVGFVEGWFVEERYRRRGVGTKLMRAAEEWARARGCRQMASDALIDNVTSHRAHEAAGFEVVDQCVHFRKAL